MKFGVVVFPGSNCDQDCVRVLRDVVRQPVATLWHQDTGLQGVDAVILPGGFSYGDYLRAGAMAAHAPIMSAVKAFAERGGPVLAICNGFQIACEAGLLEGALTRNASLRFACQDVYVRVEGRRSPFTAAIPAGRILKMSIAHAEGRYVIADVARLEAEGLVAFRYVTVEGAVTSAANPNGSRANPSGDMNAKGNVVGLMHHPERACEAILGDGGEDGRMLFASALAMAAGARARV